MKQQYIFREKKTANRKMSLKGPDVELGKKGINSAIKNML